MAVRRVFVTNPKMYSEFLPPNGFLVREPACHALFFYATMTHLQLVKFDDPIQYEDSFVTEVTYENARKRFSSIALLYTVTPEEMTKFWSNVDLQFISMGARKLPEKYRFRKIPEIKTQ